MANAAAGASGALKGAGTGAAIGSVVPGVGTAIGAIGGGLIGGLSGLFGSNGDDYQAQAAQLTPGVSAADASQANGNVQQGVAQQQAFLQALQAQGGVGNQSAALAQQQALAQQLATQNGVANSNEAFNNQRNNNAQLQGIVNGTGPNPAQAQLASATGQNVASQASLMAGQRGAGSNVGLIARQAAVQGANTQQQAVGQGAALQAQQSLAALNQQSQVQAQMQQAAQTQISQQAAQQGAVANLATQQVGQEQTGLNSAQQAAQGQQTAIQGAIANQNNAAVSSQNNVNTTMTGKSINNTNNSQAQTGGLLAGAGAAATALGGAPSTATTTPTNTIADPFKSNAGVQVAYNGGMIQPKFAAGGEVKTPQSYVGRHLTGKMMADGGDVLPIQETAIPAKAASSGGGDMLGSVASMAPQVAEMFKSGGKVLQGEKYATKGKVVPGKASVTGNSLKNDTVDAKLSPGEVIIPRSVMESKDPAAEAAKFVAAIMAKHGKGLPRG